VETRISQEGEIQVKSPMNMTGYYRDPQGTAAAFTADGFIHSGDLGEMDRDGWLRIKGRMKEQFKTAKGKYVTPSAIEMMLGTHPAIEMCLVMGSGLPAPVAIAVLTPPARENAKTAEGRLALEHSLADLLDRVNAALAPHERIASVTLTDAKWGIDNGLLTPTLKLRRAPLELRYSPFIEQWRAQAKRVVWHFETEKT